MVLQGGTASKVFGYLFSMMVLMMSIPVLLVVTKSNLDQNFNMHRSISISFTYVIPWILAIPFLTGNYLLSINVWGSLIFVTSANFVVPLVIYLKAVWFRKAYNQRRYLTKKQRDLLKIIHGTSHNNTTQSRNALHIATGVGGGGVHRGSVGGGTVRTTDSDGVNTPVVSNMGPFGLGTLFGASTRFENAGGVASTSANTIVSDTTNKSKGSLGEDLLSLSGGGIVLGSGNRIGTSCEDSSNQIPMLILHEAEEEEGGGCQVGGKEDLNIGSVDLGPLSPPLIATAVSSMGGGLLGQPIVASPMPTASPGSSVFGNDNCGAGAFTSSPSICSGPSSPACVDVHGNSSNAINGSTGLLAVPGSSLSLFTTTTRKSPSVDLHVGNGSGNGDSESAPSRVNSAVSASNSSIGVVGGGGSGQFLQSPLPPPKKKVSLLVPGSDQPEEAFTPGERHSIVESINSLGLSPFRGLAGSQAHRSGLNESLASFQSRGLLPFDLDVEQEGYLLEDVPDPDEDDEDSDKDAFDDDGDARLQSLFEDSGGEEAATEDFDKLTQIGEAFSPHHEESLKKSASINPERHGSWFHGMPWTKGNVEVLPLSRYNTWGSSPDFAAGKTIWQSIKNLRSPLTAEENVQTSPDSQHHNRSTRKPSSKGISSLRRISLPSTTYRPGLGILPQFSTAKEVDGENEDNIIEERANQSSGTILNSEGTRSADASSPALLLETDNGVVSTIDVPSYEGRATPSGVLGLDSSNLMLQAGAATTDIFTPNEMEIHIQRPETPKTVETGGDFIYAQDLIQPHFQKPTTEVVLDAGLLVTLTRATVTPISATSAISQFTPSNAPAQSECNILPSQTAPASPQLAPISSSGTNERIDSFGANHVSASRPHLSTRRQSNTSDLLANSTKSTISREVGRKGSATSLGCDTPKIHCVADHPLGRRLSGNSVVSRRGSVASSNREVACIDRRPKPDTVLVNTASGSTRGSVAVKEDKVAGTSGSIEAVARDTQVTMLDHHREKIHEEDGDGNVRYFGQEGIAKYWRRLRASPHCLPQAKKLSCNVRRNSQNRDFDSRRGSHSKGDAEADLAPKRYLTMSSQVAEESYKRAVMNMAISPKRRSADGSESVQRTHRRAKPLKAFRSIPKSFPIAPRTLAMICLVLTSVTAAISFVYTIVTSM
ncbi:UNVERIFIED_CONTAM: hypothetical protein HDU68_008583 [Siphonaria sp. JEL0065]|nr:hypothetical protein HDU68_008583 [Siphonaria sp. JEL0065]